MRPDQYDIAQICANGHVINKFTRSNPQESVNFCPRCGKETIMSCPACNNPIRGARTDASDIFGYKAPAFCINCGVPFPWTQAKRQAARDLADALNFSQDDRAILDKSIDDLIRDTPATPAAIVRFKQLMVKAGKETALMFRDILVDVLSEAAKKAL